MASKPLDAVAVSALLFSYADILQNSVQLEGNVISHSLTELRSTITPDIGRNCVYKMAYGKLRLLPTAFGSLARDAAPAIFDGQTQLIYDEQGTTPLAACKSLTTLNIRSYAAKSCGKRTTGDVENVFMRLDCQV